MPIFFCWIDHQLDPRLFLRRPGTLRLSEFLKIRTS